MKNLKKSKENKELRDQELNKVAGGISGHGWVSYVECPKCKRIYGFSNLHDDRRCPFCEGLFGR